MTNDFLPRESLVTKNLRFNIKDYFFPLLGTLGVSLKKIAKKIIPKVATNKNV